MGIQQLAAALPSRLVLSQGLYLYLQTSSADARLAAGMHTLLLQLSQVQAQAASIARFSNSKRRSQVTAEAG